MNEEDVESRQFKFNAQRTAIIFYLAHFLIIVIIILVAGLCLQSNQNSVQVVYWCTIEITLLLYHLLQQIYELRNQLYFIDLIISNPQQLAFPKKDQEYFQLNFYTRYLSSNIFLFCNDTYIQVLFFSANWFFRETQRPIPGTERWTTCNDSDGYSYSCQTFELETIAPLYHGPYLTELANLNIALLAFQCLYFLYHLILLKINIYVNQKVEKCIFDINIQSIKKESQILCIIFTIYYICRVNHCFIIYPQVKNEALLFAIGSYIFYSLIMITVLILVIILIQLKYAKMKQNIYSFITVFAVIDYIIYTNRFLNTYFRLMLILSLILTVIGTFKFTRDKDLQDIVSYQNYIFADLLIAQMVLIILMSIKYSSHRIRSIFCFDQLYFKLSNIVQQQNPVAKTSQKVQNNQDHKKQANLIKQNKRHIRQNWVEQFKQFTKFIQEKQSLNIQLEIENTCQLRIIPFSKSKKNLKNKMHSSLKVKILKFWKKKILFNLKKSKINFMRSSKKNNKQQKKFQNNAINKEIQFMDQQYLGECTICLEQFQIINQTKIIIRLNCFGNHIFHSDCINDWFKHNKKCPLCNTYQIKISLS